MKRFDLQRLYSQNMEQVVPCRPLFLRIILGEAQRARRSPAHPRRGDKDRIGAARSLAQYAGTTGWWRSRPAKYLRRHKRHVVLQVGPCQEVVEQLYYLNNGGVKTSEICCSHFALCFYSRLRKSPRFFEKIPLENARNSATITG